MTKYLFQVSYAQEGLKGVKNEEDTRRRQEVDNLAAEMGGSLESFYYAFGDRDLYFIVDLPDDASTAAASVIIGASGSAAIKTTVLDTPETIDEAVKRTVAYRSSGS